LGSKPACRNKLKKAVRPGGIFTGAFMEKLISILFDKIVHTAVWIVGSVMFICILLQIFTRTFFQVPFPWTDELARFTFLWFCFTGSITTLRKKLHLGIDYIESRMPAKAKFVNRVFVYSLIVVFGFFVGVLGYQLLDIVGSQLSPVMRIPMVWVYFSLPLTGFLYVVLGLYQLGCHLTGKKDEGVSLTDVPAEVVEKGFEALRGGIK
jgi:TRAP-type C4-dicarboxylate transport system permease small subunit